MYRSFDQFDTTMTGTDIAYQWGTEDAHNLTKAPRQGYHKDAYAEGILTGIFRDAPADCEEIRIGMRVYFKGTAASDMFILTDWLHVGSDRVRQRLEARADQVEVTQAQVDALAKPAGWVMSSRPTRRNTTEFVYTFRRAQLDQHEYRLDSRSAETVERRMSIHPNW